MVGLCRKRVDLEQEMPKLEPELETRLKRASEEAGQPANALLSEAVDQYLSSKERIAAGQHPSGKPWPKRHAVGGIITPV